MIALRRQSPFASRAKRSSSSPPSPVLDLAPMRFMAIARVSCASLLMEPNDIAPVANRLTISLGGLDFVQGKRARGFLELHQPAQRAQLPALIVDQLRILLIGLVAGRPHRMLQLADGRRIEQVIFPVDAILVLAARFQFGIGIGDRLECVFVPQSHFSGQHIQVRRLRCAKASR